MAKRPGIRLELHDPNTNEIVGQGDAWSHTEYVETNETNTDGSPKTLDQKLKEMETYNDETPTTVAIGGIPAGTDLNNMSLDQIIYNLTHPYVAPKAKLTISGGNKILERGTSATLPAMSVEVTAGSKDVVSTAFLVDGTAVNTDSTEVAGMETQTITYNYTTPITDDTYFNAEVSDGQSDVESNTITYTFVDPAYVGTVAAGTVLDSAAIIALTKKVMNKGTITNSYTVEEGCMVIATPAGWEIDQIIDPNGFNITDSFTASTVNVTTAAGDEVAYNVYVSEPTSQTNFAVKFVAE